MGADVWLGMRTGLALREPTGHVVAHSVNTLPDRNLHQIVITVEVDDLWTTLLL